MAVVDDISDADVSELAPESAWLSLELLRHAAEGDEPAMLREVHQYLDRPLLLAAAACWIAQE